jgi:hypothetical protein
MSGKKHKPKTRRRSGAALVALSALAAPATQPVQANLQVAVATAQRLLADLLHDAARARLAPVATAGGPARERQLRTLCARLQGLGVPIALRELPRPGSHAVGTAARRADNRRAAKRFAQLLQRLEGPTDRSAKLLADCAPRRR